LGLGTLSTVSPFESDPVRPLFYRQTYVEGPFSYGVVQWVFARKHDDPNDPDRGHGPGFHRLAVGLLLGGLSHLPSLEDIWTRGPHSGDPSRGHQMMDPGSWKFVYIYIYNIIYIQ
jgi:hypothetical protein